jgi:hypothetical protein
VIIYDFDVFDTAVRPKETDAIFVIDANGMLAFAVALEGFQPIAWWNPQIVEFHGDVELLEFTQGDFLDIGRQVWRLVALVDFLGGFAAKRNNHPVR